MKTKFNQFLNESKNSGIICYHRSNDYEHMERAEFTLEFSNDVTMFGRAIYFAESAGISQEFGKYMCKFEIKLQEPVLNMNDEITSEYANELLVKFNDMFNLKIDYDYDLLYEDGMQYGNFFCEINDLYNWDYAIHYQKFIQSLGFNSFKYFCTYHTDFREDEGDYGTCYGLYNRKDIKFVDGPF